MACRGERSHWFTHWLEEYEENARVWTASFRRQPLASSSLRITQVLSVVWNPKIGPLISPPFLVGSFPNFQGWKSPWRSSIPHQKIPQNCFWFPPIWRAKLGFGAPQTTWNGIFGVEVCGNDFLGKSRVLMNFAKNGQKLGSPTEGKHRNWTLR